MDDRKGRFIMADRIFLSPPHMNGNEMGYIQQAFESNWVAPLGENVNMLEKDLAAIGERNFAVATNSGSGAIHLALRSLGVEAGDLVICSDVTFSGSCNPITYLGAKPVFVDSDHETWNMSSIALERCLDDLVSQGQCPKAAVVVDLYGIPANYSKLLPVFERWNIPVVEDAAEALGARYMGKACGSFGEAGIFSFNANKIITTSGGGMVMTNEKEKAEKMFFWATQAREPGKYYFHKEIGYNYRLSNICAGIGRGQLKSLHEYVEIRRRVNRFYREQFVNLPLSFEPVFEGAESNCWLSVVLIEADDVSPDQMIDKLEEENIEARRFWNPMHCQPVFSEALFYTDGQKDSVGERLFEKGVCLPSGTAMKEEELNRVANAVKSCFTAK